MKLSESPGALTGKEIDPGDILVHTSQKDTKNVHLGVDLPDGRVHDFALVHMNLGTIAAPSFQRWSGSNALGTSYPSRGVKPSYSTCEAGCKASSFTKLNLRQVPAAPFRVLPLI